MVKGFVKTLEAAIAITLILVSVVFLFPEKVKTEPKISDTAYNCLRNLDNRGVLRYYAVNNLESNLISDLKGCIPPLFDYVVKICTTSTCSISISNKEVFLSSYLIAGENSIKPTLINLWVWLK